MRGSSEIIQSTPKREGLYGLPGRWEWRVEMNGEQKVEVRAGSVGWGYDGRITLTGVKMHLTPLPEWQYTLCMCVFWNGSTSCSTHRAGTVIVLF